MKFLAVQFFRDEKGEWHQPGTVVDLERDEAALYRSRGHIVAYQTQMVSPPETRVFDMRRKKRNAQTS